MICLPITRSDEYAPYLPVRVASTRRLQPNRYSRGGVRRHEVPPIHERLRSTRVALNAGREPSSGLTVGVHHPNDDLTSPTRPLLDSGRTRAGCMGIVRFRSAAATEADGYR